MKTLLFGKTGLVGKALFGALSRTQEIVAPSHSECDITQFSAVEKFIQKTAPEIVINATGYTKVDQAEQERDAAFKINAEAVGNLAALCASQKIILVHFSTDYVFDGSSKAGYAENAALAPLSVYGASKAAGEMEILKNMSNFYLIRTAWLFGPGGKNFVDTMLKLAEKGDPIRVVNDQIGNPTYTLDLAEAVLRLLQSQSYGIFHLVNEGDCSWYEFATEIFHQLALPQKVLPITTEELNRPALRPHYSVLRNTKAPKLRNWKEALCEYLQNKELII